MKKIFKIIYLFFVLFLVGNLFFDKRGVIGLIKMNMEKKRILEKINELNARKILFLDKKKFIESEEGIKTILILRFGKIDILKGEKNDSKTP